MYVWSRIQNQAFPWRSDLYEAFKLADNTNIQYRDIRPLMSCLYCLEKSSERIPGLIRNRRTAASAFGFNVIAYDNKDQDAADEAEKNLYYAFKLIQKYYVNSVLFGCFLLQFRWERVGNIARPRLVKRFKAYEIERYSDTEIQILLDTPILTRGELIDLENTYLQQYIGATDESNAQGGIFRTLIEKNIIAYDSFLRWSNYLVKLQGAITMLFDAETDGERFEAQTVLRNLVKENLTIVPTDAKLEYQNLVDPASGTSYDVFDSKINQSNSIAITGQANNAEMPTTGTYSAMAVLSKVSGDVIYDDLANIEELSNRLLLYYYQINYNEAATDCPWKFKFKYEEEYTLNDRGTFINDLKAAGIKVKSDEIYNFIQLTKPDGTDDIIDFGAGNGNKL